MVQQWAGRATLDWRSSHPVSNNSARLSGFGVSFPHLSVELCLSGLCPFTVAAISTGEPVPLSLEPLLKSEVLASSLQEQGNSVRDHNVRSRRMCRVSCWNTTRHSCSRSRGQCFNYERMPSECACTVETQIFWHCNRSLGCPAVHTGPFTGWSWQLKVQPPEFRCISKTSSCRDLRCLSHNTTLSSQSGPLANSNIMHL